MNLRSIGVVITIIVLVIIGFVCQEIILLNENLSLSLKIILSCIQAICWILIPIVAYILLKEKFLEGEIVRELRDYKEPTELEYKHTIKKKRKIVEQKSIKIVPIGKKIKEGK